MKNNYQFLTYDTLHLEPHRVTGTVCMQKRQGIDTSKFRTSVLRTFVLFAIFIDDC